MTAARATTHRDALSGLLREVGPLLVAVSGGVDSMTLAALAHRAAGRQATMVHAVSPAVPPLATSRVRDLAAREGWTLRLIDAGEFQNLDYRLNPVDRCFFCKGSLYGAIAARFAGRILSGTNTDDLGEYRPGLEAARAHGVRHPYVEAGIDKAGVRALAAALGLGDLADLPSSPCLSSRVETLIPIEADMLAGIDAVERHLADRLGASTVRCRIRAAGIVVELDVATLSALSEVERLALSGPVLERLPARFADRPLRFAAYRTGSAFVGAPASSGISPRPR